MIPTKHNIQCYKQTSLNAYLELIPELGARRAEVYEALKRFPHSSNAKLAAILNIPINCVTPRTNELVKMGFVEEKGKGYCVETGRTVILWGVK